MEELSEGILTFDLKGTLRPLMYAKQYLDKREAFWKQVLWTDEVKMNHFGHNHQRLAWERGNEQHFMKRASRLILGMGVDLFALGLYGSQW